MILKVVKKKKILKPFTIKEYKTENPNYFCDSVIWAYPTQCYTRHGLNQS